MTPRWHDDAGHGWLEVPLDTCDGLSISQYSYMDRANGVAYLEEDCDAAVWIRHHGMLSDYRSWPSTHHDGDAFIRSLPRYGR